MQKKSIEFINSVIEWEEEVFKLGSIESVIGNRFWKNLFCIFEDKEKVKEYLVYCCENKIQI
jgi:hypothetical protein